MNDHFPATAPPPELPPRTRSRKHTVLAVVLSTVGVLIAAIVVAGFLIHLPYVIISPGSATPLDSQVVADRRRADVPRRPRQRPLPHRAGVDARTERVARRHVVARSRPRGREAQQRPGLSHRRAEPGVQLGAHGPVAERRQVRRAHAPAGTPFAANPVQVRIVEVCRDAPAHGALETGDQVLAVDGTDIADATAIGDLVRAHKPGDRVSITFDRNGVTRTASITAGKYRTEGSGDGERQTCVPANGSTSGTTASACRRRSS